MGGSPKWVWKFLQNTVCKYKSSETDFILTFELICTTGLSQ